MNRRLYRSYADRRLFGVCGGIGEFFGIDPTLVRLAWAIFCCMGGAGILAYLIATLIIPPATDF